MKIEWWKFIQGFDCKYMVSNYGRVLSLSYGKTNEPRLLLLNEHDSHYLYVTLYKDRKRKDLRVNRLVAFAFPEICGDYFEGAQCMHINDIRQDNRAVNLKWGSCSENINSGNRNKKMSEISKNRKDCSKPVEQYTLDGEFIDWYPSAMEAYRKTGIIWTSILKCCRGIQQKTITNGIYTWRFA